MIRILIFDIGGVILDYGEKEYYEYLSSRYKIPHKKIRETFDPLIRTSEYGKMSQKKLITTASKALRISKEGLEWNRIFETFAKRNEKVVGLMKKLKKKYTIVLLSNISRSRFTAGLPLLKSGFYDNIFASCYLGMRKPEKKIFRHVLQAMRASPHECLFIDNLKVNVDGAKSVGIKAIEFRDVQQLKRDLAKAGIRP